MNTKEVDRMREITFSAIYINNPEAAAKYHETLEIIKEYAADGYTAFSYMTTRELEDSEVQSQVNTMLILQGFDIDEEDDKTLSLNPNPRISVEISWL